MKIVFMGTPDFAAYILQKLHDDNREVAAVVTNPDRSRGRSERLVYSEVKTVALECGYPVLQPVKARDPEFIEELKKLAPDMIIVAAYGQILPQSLLDIPAYGCINVHASLLPKYRGAAPINQAIIDGCEVTGVTTMLMSAGLDTGDILLQREVAIDRKETAGSLFDKLAVTGAELLLETIDGLADGSVTPKPQTGEASYVKMMKKDDGLIDWNESAVRIERLIRGLDPWPGAFTFINDKRVRILAADALPDDGTVREPGSILGDLKTELCFSTGEGILSVTRLQAEGKKAMAVDEFLRGFRI